MSDLTDRGEMGGEREAQDPDEPLEGIVEEVLGYCEEPLDGTPADGSWRMWVEGGDRKRKMACRGD